MTDHEIYVLDSALNYVKHLGANHTMRGKPHPQQWIVDGLEALLASERAKPRPEVAERDRYLKGLKVLREVIRNDPMEHMIVDLQYPDVGLGQWMDTLLEPQGERS
jgi:hypothetical protein